MKLLHAGPMKTGSTAFQELLGLNRPVLERSEIRFRHLRRPDLEGWRPSSKRRKELVAAGAVAVP